MRKIRLHKKNPYSADYYDQRGPSSEFLNTKLGCGSVVTSKVENIESSFFSFTIDEQGALNEAVPAGLCNTPKSADLESAISMDCSSPCVLPAPTPHSMIEQPQTLVITAKGVVWYPPAPSPSTTTPIPKWEALLSQTSESDGMRVFSVESNAEGARPDLRNTFSNMSITDFSGTETDFSAADTTELSGADSNVESSS